MVLVMLWGVYPLKAQDGFVQQKGYHQHNGFYLSMNLGPTFLSVKDQLSDSYISPYNREYNGMGVMLDLKLGWALKENLILHATLISNIMNDPTTKNKHPLYEEFSSIVDMGDELIGAGVTYYLMPSNILLSCSMGVGQFSVTDTQGMHKNINSESGFAMQLKLGKEWWVSKNWGLGVGLTYGNNVVISDPQFNQSNELSSQHFGILFNTTFN